MQTHAVGCAQCSEDCSEDSDERLKDKLLDRLLGGVVHGLAVNDGRNLGISHYVGIRLVDGLFNYFGQKLLKELFHARSAVPDGTNPYSRLDPDSGHISPPPATACADSSVPHERLSYGPRVLRSIELAVGGIPLIILRCSYGEFS